MMPFPQRELRGRRSKPLSLDVGADIALQYRLSTPSLPGSRLLVQPGLDVAAPVTRNRPTRMIAGPGPLLSPLFQRPQADLQLIGRADVESGVRWSSASRVAAELFLTVAGPSRLGRCSGLRRALNGLTRMR